MAFHYYYYYSLACSLGPLALEALNPNPPKNLNPNLKTPNPQTVALGLTYPIPVLVLAPDTWPPDLSPQPTPVPVHQAMCFPAHPSQPVRLTSGLRGEVQAHQVTL